MPGFTDALRAKILVVDDQECNIRLLALALRRAGYSFVDTTTDPLAVDAMHRQNRYDLIILDLQMPRLNGFGVMNLLREGERVSVLVLSADPAQMVPALEAGAMSFMSKPFVLAELLARVSTILKTAPGPASAGPDAIEPPLDDIAPDV